jgi:hypothetical protein
MDLAAQHTQQPLVQATAWIVLARVQVAQAIRHETPVGPEENRPYVYQYNSSRPAMAEAWLTAAEVALFQTELEACLEGDQASGARRSCLRVPWMVKQTSNEEDDKEEWNMSTPLVGEGRLHTYLGPHWWGQPAGVAVGLLTGEASTHLDRYVSGLDKSKPQSCAARRVVSS